LRRRRIPIRDFEDSLSLQRAASPKGGYKVFKERKERAGNRVTKAADAKFPSRVPSQRREKDVAGSVVEERLAKK